MNFISIYGGGTVSHVRNHLALAMPAYGNTARRLSELLLDRIPGYQPSLRLTKMASSGMSDMETNEDVERMLKVDIANPNVKAIIFNVGLADYTGKVGNLPSGKYMDRLKTANGVQAMVLTPADKLLGQIRKTRKDIFLVAFKTTAGATEDQQYIAGLALLKQNSCNLVLANDTITRNNLIIVPEEARYGMTTDRETALRALLTVMAKRMTNTFTRSNVVDKVLTPWIDPAVPSSLRHVVDWCVARGAYKPFLGKTAGHFAVKLSDREFLTSRRKSNFNESLDLVRIELGEDRTSVIAHGAKPSVGGQSQRIVFEQHEDLDCIVHAHIPMRQGSAVNSVAQWPFECGSHQCGANTSEGLRVYRLSSTDYVKAVMLENHGPNIVFNRNTDPDLVIRFIQDNFNLGQKTGGLVA